MMDNENKTNKKRVICIMIAVFIFLIGLAITAYCYFWNHAQYDPTVDSMTEFEHGLEYGYYTTALIALPICILLSCAIFVLVHKRKKAANSHEPKTSGGKRMLWVVVSFFAAVAVSALAVLFAIKYFLDDYLAIVPLVIFGVLALVLWITFNNQRMQCLGNKHTEKFLSHGGKGKELVDLVADTGETKVIINGKNFAEGGLQMVLVCPSSDSNVQGNSWPVIVTKDCIYEEEIQSYSFPADAKLRFGTSAEETKERRYKMDVKKSAAFGYVVGGAGAALYNASKAQEINANGGNSYTEGTGQHHMYISTGGCWKQVHFAIISNAIMNALPDNLVNKYFGDLHVKGTYFAVYRLPSLNLVSINNLAKNYNKLIEFMIESGKH